MGIMRKQIITIIAAISENNVIGRNNKLIWHLPEDLKRFKKLTSGHSVIMGRKTFESINKALPNRHNIVVSKNREFSADGVTVCNSLEKALLISINDNQPFIIGGGQIYAQAINLADKIELTKIKKLFDGDVFFPKIDTNIWQLSKKEKMKDNSLEYFYLTYVKKQI
tara:strand:+ start:12 stop:512 length:501 start_codon:yes stop_codon:yes gene_type:complete